MSPMMGDKVCGGVEMFYVMNITEAGYGAGNGPVVLLVAGYTSDKSSMII